VKTLAINNPVVNNKNNVAFKGHNAYTSNAGFVRHKFFLPYDEHNYTAQIEFRQFEEQNGEWVPVENSEIESMPLPQEGLELKNSSLFSDHKTINGYRYVLTLKNNPSQKIYHVDSGVITNAQSNNADEHFTLLFPRRAVLSTNGLTKQVMPDICFPGYYLDKNGELKFNSAERARALNAVRNHGNKLGGQFAGIIRMLPIWQQEGYTKIVGTPFTKDEVSSHLYWTENPLQIASGLGTLDDFKKFQIELFKNGINFIADGAFVNQGLQGVLFKDVLKHGEESPFFHWFKASGILGGDFKLGAIPQKPAARANFRFRLVNAPQTIVEDEDGKVKFVKNRNYDSTKTTYIQLYDKRLVEKKLLNCTNDLFKRYEKTNTENPYEITNHDDITQLLAFEIKPSKLKANIKRTLDGMKKDDISFDNNGFVESLLTFPNFRITTKDKGGVDLWDGNMDIAKLNFYAGNTDQSLLDRFSQNPADQKREIQRLRNAVYQVQDYTLQAGKYWTKVVSDTQFEYIANVLRNVEPTVESYKSKINEEIAKGNLPQKLKEVFNDAVISNVLNDKYNFEKTSKFPKDVEAIAFVRELVMDFPLDSIELAPDLTGVLASPFISKRAANEPELFMKRRQIFCENTIKDPDDRYFTEYSDVYDKADYLLAQQISTFTLYVLQHINSRLNMNDGETRLFHQGSPIRVTEYGKYVIPLLIPDIMKFIIVKGFKPSAEINLDRQTGKIDYSKAHTEDISLSSLAISGSPKSEAYNTIVALKNGVKKFMDLGDRARTDLEATLASRFYNVKLHQLQMAEAIMDKTETGLGWRIDAAKDIGNIDALRTGNDNDERLLSQVTEFWKNFNDVVKEENKHAYTTAEITDLDSILATKDGEFKNGVNAETKFIERSGLNNTANYMFFYSMPKELFAKSAETGAQTGDFNNVRSIYDKLITGWTDGNNVQKCHGFLFQYPGDSVVNSYTFVGNHDKPRPLHIFALDMDLFHSNMQNANHQDRAVNVLNLSDKSQLDSTTTSAKAVAMGERLLDAFIATGIINENDKQNPIRQAITELASGNYKGKPFDAEAFGTRDFRNAIKDVLDVAEFKANTKFNNRNEMFDKVLENILAPAMDKMESVYKMLVTLPGSPTDFVGDKEGSTGYETKSNNDYQQNRNVVPFEWVNATLNDRYLEKSKGEKPFVNAYYRRMTEIGRLRSRKELSALRNGETIALPMQHGVAVKDGNTINSNVEVAATFRYDDAGSQVICLYTTDGATTNCNQKMDRHVVNLDKIVLGKAHNRWKEGLKAGLKEGDMFKNANNDAIYKVSIENGEYVLRRTHSAYKAVSIMPQDKNTAVLYKINYEDPEKGRIPANHYYPGMK